MALAFVALPCLAATKMTNTSTYVGAVSWDSKMFVEGDCDTLKQIDCVEYTLHPTFPDPVRKVCSQPETKFALSNNGWGTLRSK